MSTSTPRHRQWTPTSLRDASGPWRSSGASSVRRRKPSDFATTCGRSCHRRDSSKRSESLKDEGGFDMLAELGGVDYLKYPGRDPNRPRFEVHYVLLNLETATGIVIKAGVDDPDPRLPSVVPLWLGADWMEREVFDMYRHPVRGPPRPAPDPDARASSSPSRSARTTRCAVAASGTTSPASPGRSRERAGPARCGS